MRADLQEQYDEEGDLRSRAQTGDVSVLSHSRVSKIYDSNFLRTKANRTLLHTLAARGVVEVLNHPDVAVVRDAENRTALHYLAGSGKGADKVIKHSQVSLVKDDNGETPLHYLAANYITAVWRHPDYRVVTNVFNRTPYDIFPCPNSIDFILNSDS